MTKVATIAGKSREEFLRLYNKILKAGLSDGICDSEGRVCIEAAVCIATGDTPLSAYKLFLKDTYRDDHENVLSDQPSCVHIAVANFKINLNDLGWSSPKARAEGLYDLGIAQLGTKKQKNFGHRFTKALAKAFHAAAIEHITEEIGFSLESPYLPDVASRLDQMRANENNTDPDFFKKLLASTAVEVLRKLKAPGVQWLDVVKKVK